MKPGSTAHVVVVGLGAVVEGEAEVVDVETDVVEGAGAAKQEAATTANTMRAANRPID